MAATSVLILAILVVASCVHAQEAPMNAPGPSVFAPGPVASGPVAMPPADPCMDALLSLASCLTYVEKGSNLTTPEDGCCSGLATLVATNPICLCQLVGNNPSVVGVPIDVTKSIGLPKVCKVDTPPVSLCAAINGSPTSSPAGSPGPMMPGMPGGVGMPPSMSMAPGMPASPPAPGNGGRSTRELSLAAVVGLSSVAVAILF
ncbi:hypothetical protein ACHQM5_012175 [Ranunculus cassubicifolius]